MPVEPWGMMGAGSAVLVAGLFLVRPRFAVASGVDRVLVLGPVFEAVALAIFAAEHFWQHAISQSSCRAGCQDLCFGPISWVRHSWLLLSASSRGDTCAGLRSYSHCCS